MVEPSPALRLRHVAMDYPSGWWRRRRTVLAGIELELAPGARLALIGPNGAGKSTLLRLAAGIERPRAGTVEVFGTPVEERAVRRRVGFLPEGDPFPRELSARRALELLGTLVGLERGERRRRVPQMLERVGLAHDGHRRLGAFSRGMRQRFALAQAFLHEPDLLLLDEPEAGLDAAGEAALDQLAEEARGRGASFVVCSHDPRGLAASCDSMALLVDGSLVATGAPDELLGDDASWLELEGLDRTSLDAIARAVEANGGRVTGRGPARRAWRDAYRRARGGGNSP